jgi:murein DD-endopeptidase MepM/ murein hydrolase activator NlpD
MSSSAYQRRTDRYRTEQCGPTEPLAGAKRDYTIAHAGRQLRVGPLGFWTAVCLIGAMALWSGGTAAYFAFRDDLLTRVMSRQADMQYAYEDRISELRAQIDRLTSRQLLDQEQVEQRIKQLARRQVMLESRASALSALPDAIGSGPARAAPAKASLPAERAKPSPINDNSILAPVPDRRAQLGSRVPVKRLLVKTAAQSEVAAALTNIEDSLDRIEARQSASLLALEDMYAAMARSMRGGLVDLGIDLKTVGPGAATSGVGGPFVPLAAGDAFERQLRRIESARGHVERLNRALLTVPLRRPLAGELEVSSGFGVRMDPFVRAPALHSGLDLRASHGEAARATAAGTVVTAGWAGGYGRMVEIDHGNGFSTRYGHLSEILVKEDQVVRPGQIIGRVGSSGRSTGPHLHYETRIDGEAVDPHRFLRAGLRLGQAL